MSSVRQSLALSFAQKNSVLFINLLAALVLARLLTPEEIGIASVGTVIVGFTHIIKDFGISNYLVQERNLTIDRIRSAQSIIFLTSWTIACLVWISATPVAAFYREPGVAQVIQALAVNFAFVPFGAITIALLNRDFSFAKLYRINVLSAVISNGTCVVFAYNGFGFISLPWGAIAGSLSLVLLSTYYRHPLQDLRPGFSEWRTVVSKGMRLSGSSFFSELGVVGPELVLGRIMGFEAVGYFSRAMGTAMLALRGMVDGTAPVLLSFYARSAREGGDLAPHLIRGLALVSVIAWPIFGYLWVASPELISLMFGAQWSNSVPPLKILCFGFAALSLLTVSGTLLVGGGWLTTHLRVHAIFQPIKLVLVILASARLGLAGAAAAIALSDILLSAYAITQAARHAGVGAQPILHVLLHSLMVLLTTVLCTYVTHQATQPLGNAFAILALTGGGTLLAWLATTILLRHPILQEMLRLGRAARLATRSQSVAESPRALVVSSYPNPFPGNPAIALLYSHLEREGVSYTDSGYFGQGWLWRNRGTIDFLHFHRIGEFYSNRYNGVSLGRLIAFLAKLRLARLLGYRLIWTMHDLDPRRANPSLSAWLARLLIVHSVDLVLVDFAEAVADVRRLYRRARNVQVVPHGNYRPVYPEPPDMSESRQRLGIAPDAFVFLVLEGCGPDLGAYQAIKALRGLGGNRRIELCVVGKYPMPDGEKTLRELMREDSRVKMHLSLQDLSAAENCDWLAAADCMVVPSTDACISRALSLAATFGKPMVAARCGQFVALESESFLFLYDETTETDGLCKAMMRAMSSDPGLTSEASRAFADRYVWQDIAKTAAAHLRRIAACDRRRIRITTIAPTRLKPIEARDADT